MALSKMSDLKNLSVAEIDAKVQELKKELFDLRFQKATKETIQPHRFKHIRHEIAQLLTLKQQQS